METLGTKLPPPILKKQEFRAEIFAVTFRESRYSFRNVKVLADSLTLRHENTEKPLISCRNVKVLPDFLTLRSANAEPVPGAAAAKAWAV